ncbi:phosphodiester glycosidase family protein [bacterium AH-315-J21]|nr:phosphodiester glycosidase family protein [bacterium AH-315-J21]
MYKAPKLQVVTFCILTLLLSASCSSSNETTWETLDNGLELGSFNVTIPESDRQARIIVMRVNPTQWRLELRARSQQGGENDKNAKQWTLSENSIGSNDAEKIVVATNAGMFNTDYSSHIGYMHADEHTNNAHILRNKYYSAALFGTLEDSLPEFQLIDLDETDLESLKDKYRYVIQNLRLIKYPSENRWQEQERKWSEAALAQDVDGNALFLFSREPMTMFEFNEIILSLPLEIVRAQHLEGGPEAQLYYQVGKHSDEFTGSYESSFSDFSKGTAWPIPNVIVVKRVAIDK